MKLAVIMLGALACVGAPPPTSGAAIEPATQPLPLVILVHGRGQLGLDTAAMRREWKRDLDASLASVGLPALRDDDVRLAWYADALDPNAENECARPVSGGGVEELGLGDVTRALFASLASALPANESRGARSVFGELLYFLDGDTRCAAGKRFGAQYREAIAQNRPVVIVAYSLGSVVTYDYLKTHGATGADVRLITAGSPLGAREFRELLFGVGAPPPALPSGVTTWVNLYDPDDPFASPVGAPTAIDWRTESPYGGSAHYHGRYLRDPAMGRALGRAICASSARALGDGCRALR